MSYISNKNEVPFYILAGQSNCGSASVDEFTAPQLALYGGVRANIKIYNPLFDIAAYPKMETGVNTLTYAALYTDNFGPEVAFFKQLNDYHAWQRYILKDGIGNTNLYEQWNSRTSFQYYYYLCIYVDNIIAKLKQIGNPVLKGFIWMQGEADSLDLTMANAYATNLQNFFDDFKAFYKTRVISNSLPPSNNDFVTIIGRINFPAGTYRATIRSAQAAYCAIGANNAVMIDTDSYPLRDGVHYDATGQIQFGTDIFDILKLTA